jgi:hypothetical protein
MPITPDLPALSPLDSLADLEPDAAVGGAVNALRGVLAGGTPAQVLRAAEMICRVWLAGRRHGARTDSTPKRTRGPRGPRACVRIPPRAHSSSVTVARSSRMYIGRPAPLLNVWPGSMPSAW